jgi:hypothetical protein
MQTNLPPLEALGVSLLASSYQAGKLIVLSGAHAAAFRLCSAVSSNRWA